MNIAFRALGKKVPTHNGEDQTIRRLLGNPESGFYVDVGANHPHRMSNTHSFYEAGWVGLDIEPIPDQAAELRKFHPRNVVLECAVGAEAEMATLYCPANRSQCELATLRPDLRDRHHFVSFEDIRVEVRTLNDILGQHAHQPIDFINLDVGGYEREALLGLNLRIWRPRLFVIESIIPNTDIPCFEDWEDILLKSDYQMIGADPANRYYQPR